MWQACQLLFFHHTSPNPQNDLVGQEGAPSVSYGRGRGVESLNELPTDKLLVGGSQGSYQVVLPQGRG